MVGVKFYRGSRASTVTNRCMMAQRLRADLITFFQEQTGYLQSSSRAFDAGNVSESKRLATALRILLHDTKTPHSLLKQLGVKENLLWHDTAEPFNPNNSLSTLGLLMMRMKSGKGANYMAPLAEGPFENINKPISFEPWWRSPVCKVNVNDQIWSREQFVLVLANKEGGAHVDPNLHPPHESLVKENAMGWIYSGADGERPFDGNIVAESVRQIAHEVLTTFNKQQSSWLE